MGGTKDDETSTLNSCASLVSHEIGVRQGDFPPRLWSPSIQHVREGLSLRTCEEFSASCAVRKKERFVGLLKRAPPPGTNRFEEGDPGKGGCRPSMQDIECLRVDLLSSLIRKRCWVGSPVLPPSSLNVCTVRSPYRCILRQRYKSIEVPPLHHSLKVLLDGEIRNWTYLFVITNRSISHHVRERLRMQQDPRKREGKGQVR